MVKALLIKPLDGHPEGSEREFNQADFDRLVSKGAIRAVVERKAAPKIKNKKAPDAPNKMDN